MSSEGQGNEVEVCRSFRNNGRCKWGDDCKFEHSEGEPIQVTRRKPQECYTFRDEGECKHGEGCRFLHGPDDQRFENQDITKEVCRNFKRGRCRIGDKCLRQHIEPTEEEVANNSSEGKPKRARRRKKRDPAKTRCRYWSRNGNCEKGDECEFQHVDKVEEEQKQEGEQAEKPKSKNKRKNKKKAIAEDADKPIEEQVCRNWALGKCRFGANCRRVHEGDIPQKPPQKIDEICRKFQSGTCAYGEQCRRQHVLEESAPAEA